MEEEKAKDWSVFKKTQIKRSLELIISQLTRLGICEVSIHLLGKKRFHILSSKIFGSDHNFFSFLSLIPHFLARLGNKWISQELFLTTLNTCNLFLEAGHIITEENRVVQENMISYLAADMGEPTSCNLQLNLAKSIAWARLQRESTKNQRKSQLLEFHKKNRALLDYNENRLESKNTRGESKNTRGETKDTTTSTTSTTDTTDSDVEISIDPGGSTEIMRMFDLLCSGQYRVAQLFMANQELHKEPVDFLIDSSKYIAQMAKDFRSKPLQLFQAYGSLKSFLTGPCKENQLHMAMETECVLVTNRILRELYKEASKIYKSRKAKKKEGSNGSSTNSKKKNSSNDTRGNSARPTSSTSFATTQQHNQLTREEIETITLEWSSLGKEVVETLLSMIEGRTDAVVHNKILAVVQPRNLKDRLTILKDMITSDYFTNRTERSLTGEGVEIMNLLMTLSEHDAILNKQIMLGMGTLFATMICVICIDLYFFYSLHSLYCLYFHTTPSTPPPPPQKNRRQSQRSLLLFSIQNGTCRNYISRHFTSCLFFNTTHVPSFFTCTFEQNVGDMSTTGRNQFSKIPTRIYQYF